MKRWREPIDAPVPTSCDVTAQGSLISWGRRLSFPAGGLAKPPWIIAAEEIAMPAQQGQGLTRKQSDVGRGQALAETGEQEAAISRPPTRPLDLALADAKPVPESQELMSELGLPVTSICRPARAALG
jgi:hypothetical protein